MTVSVTREPLTYEYDNYQTSFVYDLVRAGVRGDDAAKARLERHQQEMDVELRTNPNTTARTGGEFAPPLWVIEQFSTAPRAGRVLADLVNKLPLPPGVSEVHAPKITTSATAAIQSGQDGVTEVDEVTADAGGTGNVVTIAGESDVSLQLFDQTPSPGYDAIAYLDLMRGYNANLEVELLAGTGTNGRLTGVQNVTSRISDISGSGVSATQATGVPQFWPLVGQACAGVSNTRKLPVEVILMAPRRWYWTAFLTVAISTSQQSPFPALPSDENWLLNAGEPAQGGGVPIYLDGAIPGLTNADVAIACRPSDMLLYESEPKFAVDLISLSGTLQARLQLRRYAAFLVLKPSSICVVTALPAPTSYGA